MILFVSVIIFFMGVSVFVPVSARVSLCLSKLFLLVSGFYQFMSVRVWVFLCVYRSASLCDLSLSVSVGVFF